MDHLEDGGESVEEFRSTSKSTIHEVAMETIGERPQMPRGHLYASEQTKLLSEHQLGMGIQPAQDSDTDAILRSMRKDMLRRLHRQLKADAVAYWNDKVN